MVDKHELKMKMKIAECYVSLTGMFWTTNHLKQTPLVFMRDLQVLRDNSQTMLTALTTINSLDFFNTVWVILDHRHIQSKTTCTMELKEKMAHTGTHTTAGLSYLLTLKLTMLIKSAQVLRDSTHIDCHY